MRIQSNYKDYYDHLQKYVYGESSTYMRAWCKCDVSRIMPNIIPQDQHNRFKACAIGFCGTIYGFARYIHYWDEEVIVRGYSKPQKRSHVSYEPVWSIDEINDKWKKYYPHYHSILSKEERRRFGQYFFTTKDDSIFIQQNTPIFFIERNNWMGKYAGLEAVCCPLIPHNHTAFDYSLGDLKFDTIVDDKRAYSELVDYISFLGMEHKTVPQMSNSNKIESHGFTKSSFRRT